MYLSNSLNVVKHAVGDNFVFPQKNVLSVDAHNTGQLLQCRILKFIATMLLPISPLMNS